MMRILSDKVEMISPLMLLLAAIAEPDQEDRCSQPECTCAGFLHGLGLQQYRDACTLGRGFLFGVQIPEKLQTVWDWRVWTYDPSKGQIVNKSAPDKLVPYNYIVYSVSRYENFKS